jgi:hypothetical protein
MASGTFSYQRSVLLGAKKKLSTSRSALMRRRQARLEVAA